MVVTFRACLPSIWPPYTKACLESMAPEFRDHVVVLDNTVVNRGVAASWNVVAREVIEDQLDWFVILSAATRFGRSGGVDFVRLLDGNSDAWVIESGWPSRGNQWVGWHLLAWSRIHVLERIGLFDENAWPAYGEDADISWRVLTAMIETGEEDVWRKPNVDAWVQSIAHGAHLAGALTDFPSTWAYHQAKWGGLSGHETFSRPFDDPLLPLSFWPVPPDPRARDHAGWGL